MIENEEILFRRRRSELLKSRTVATRTVSDLLTRDKFQALMEKYQISWDRVY